MAARRTTRDIRGTGRSGFYGLDVYSLWESMAAVIEYLDRIDPEAARNARRAYGCFDRFHGDAEEYARSTALTPTSCENDVVRMLATLRAQRAAVSAKTDATRTSAAEQNALVAIECGAILSRDDTRRSVVMERARPSHGATRSTG